MNDLDKALEEITLIRSQMARGLEFRGLGAVTLAATGVLAVVVAVVQAVWLDDPLGDVAGYLMLWIGIAAISAVLIGVETLTRAQRLHSGLAQEMILAAIEQFLPALGAGALLTAVLFYAAPAELWLLPGLWQVVFSLGLFASRRSLPAAIGIAGFWYMLTGLACLALARGVHALSPWAMGVPFGLGQALIALVVFCHKGVDDGEA